MSFTNAQLMRKPKHDLVYLLRQAEGLVEDHNRRAQERETSRKELVDTMNCKIRQLEDDFNKLKYDLREIREQRDVYWALLKKLVGR